MALTNEQLLILDNLIYLRPVSSGEYKTVGEFILRVTDENGNLTADGKAKILAAEKAAKIFTLQAAGKFDEADKIDKDANFTSDTLDSAQKIINLVKSVPSLLDLNIDYTSSKFASDMTSAGENEYYRDGITAACFSDSIGNATVIYRGTDGYEAWADNVKAGCDTDTEMQEKALRFFENIPKLTDYKDIELSGHSKGGNMVQYITVVSQHTDLVSHTVSYDGQGFSSDFMSYYQDKIAANASKIISYSAEYDVVNALLHQLDIERIYVESCIIDPNPFNHHFPAVIFGEDNMLNDTTIQSEVAKQVTLIIPYAIAAIRAMFGDDIANKDMENIGEVIAGAMVEKKTDLTLLLEDDTVTHLLLTGAIIPIVQSIDDISMDFLIGSGADAIEIQMKDLLTNIMGDESAAFYAEHGTQLMENYVRFSLWVFFGRTFGGGTVDVLVADTIDEINLIVDSLQESIMNLLETASEFAESIWGGMANIFEGLFTSETITGTSGADNLIGDDGDNKIFGYNGNDMLSGESGNDEIYGGHGNDNIYGDAGSDLLDGNEGNDKLYGGDGNDMLYGGNGINWLYGNVGDDDIYGGDEKDFMYGGEGTDRIFGGNGPNNLFGDSGDDYIIGGNDVDIMKGGVGNDYLDGGNGNNKMYGEADDDNLQGGINDDYMEGGTGNDQLSGGNGINTMYGNLGNDIIHGGNNDDIIDGGDDDDNIFAGNGNNAIIGGNGNDIIYGGDNDDHIEGGLGTDKLYAGGGNDYLDGGEGDDYLQGNHGDDTYIFGSGYGFDAVEDSDGNNKIVFKDGITADLITLQVINYSGLQISVNGTEDKLLINNFTNSGTFELDFADGSIGIINKDSWTLDILASAPTSIETYDVTMQANAETLNALYFQDNSITDVNANILACESGLESNNFYGQANTQVMIMIDNMASFSSESNISWSEQINSGNLENVSITNQLLVNVA